MSCINVTEGALLLKKKKKKKKKENLNYARVK